MSSQNIALSKPLEVLRVTYSPTEGGGVAAALRVSFCGEKSWGAHNRPSRKPVSDNQNFYMAINHREK